MSEPLVKVQVHDEAGTILLNRAEKRNALSRELVAELDQAIEDLHLERRARAVIITGAGTAFCAGLDLVEMHETAQLPSARTQWETDSLAYRDLLEKMLRFPKPLIAAVNGPAMAGGAGLVLACDIVVAAHEARFGLPEPMRGIAAAAVAPLLAFRVGAGPAAFLLTTAGVISAERAQHLNIYHELVDQHWCWTRAKELAAHCAKCAPTALQLNKKMLNETIGEEMLRQLTSGAAMSASSRTTEAAVEGLKAFREKREPNWE